VRHSPQIGRRESSIQLRVQTLRRIFSFAYSSERIVLIKIRPLHL
jgi:hypothetical protein